MTAADLPGRRTERGLLALGGIILLVGFALVYSARENFALQIGPLLMLALYFGGVATIHFFLCRWRHTGDSLFLPLTAFLVGLGLVMLFRLKPALLPYQLTWSMLGLAAFLAVIRYLRRSEILEQYKYVSGAAGVILLLSPLVMGVSIGGAKSWVVLGPLRFEPSEMAKILIVIFLAGYLGERKELLANATRRVGPVSVPHPRYLGPLVVMWGLAVVLLVMQKDLGTALLFFGTFLCMLYAASGRSSFVATGLLLFLLAATASYYLFAHVRSRITVWADPWAQSHGSGFQIIQSLFALGTGGLFGAGLGYGYPGLIPEVHTDFVLAAIGEELGLFGTLGVLALYVLLFMRGFRTALAARQDFNALLATGLSTLLALQTFVIAGGVTKFLPLTGVTLPFISYGGSSLVTNLILVALLLNLSE